MSGRSETTGDQWARLQFAEAEVQRLREERDGWEKIAESRALYAHKQAARMGAHASDPQPTPVSGVPLAATGKASEGAEDGTGIDTRYRGRAEDAEAEVQRLTALKDEVVELSAKLERGLLNASAEIVRLREGLRDLLDAFPMDDPYGSLWTEYRAAQDKARALIAGSEAAKMPLEPDPVHWKPLSPDAAPVDDPFRLLGDSEPDGGGAK